MAGGLKPGNEAEPQSIAIGGIDNYSTILEVEAEIWGGASTPPPPLLPTPLLRRFNWAELI